MKKQMALIDDSIDNPTASAADELVEILNQLDELKERKEETEAKLISLMNKAMKYKFRHHGRTFELKNSEPKQKIKVKEEKTK